MGRKNIYGGDFPLHNYGSDYAQAVQSAGYPMNQEYLIWYRRPHMTWEFSKQRATNQQDALARVGVPRDATAFVTRVIDTKKFIPKQDAFPWIESSP